MANQSAAEAMQLKWVLDLVGSPLYAAAFCAGIAVGLKEGVLGMLVAPTLGLRRRKTPVHKVSAKVAEEEKGVADVTGMQGQPTEARAPLTPTSYHVEESAAAPVSTTAPVPVPVTIQADQPTSPNNEAPKTPQPTGSSLAPSVASASPTPAPFTTTDMPQDVPVKIIATEAPTSPVALLNEGDAAAMIATTVAKTMQSPTSPGMHLSNISEQFLNTEVQEKIASAVAQLTGSKVGTPDQQARQGQMLDMPHMHAAKADVVSQSGASNLSGSSSAAGSKSGARNSALTSSKHGGSGRHKTTGKKAALR